MYIIFVYELPILMIFIYFNNRGENKYISKIFLIWVGQYVKSWSVIIYALIVGL